MGALHRPIYFLLGPIAERVASWYPGGVPTISTAGAGLTNYQAMMSELHASPLEATHTKENEETIARMNFLDAVARLSPQAESPLQLLQQMNASAIKLPKPESLDDKTNGSLYLSDIVCLEGFGDVTARIINSDNSVTIDLFRKKDRSNFEFANKLDDEKEIYSQRITDPAELTEARKLLTEMAANN